MVRAGFYRTRTVVAGGSGFRFSVGTARRAVRAAFSGATGMFKTLENPVPSAERGRRRRSAAPLPSIKSLTVKARKLS